MVWLTEVLICLGLGFRVWGLGYLLSQMQARISKSTDWRQTLVICHGVGQSLTAERPAAAVSSHGARPLLHRAGCLPFVSIALAALHLGEDALTLPSCCPPPPPLAPQLGCLSLL